MRISDWSSDVCSSDLTADGRRGPDYGAAIPRQSGIPMIDCPSPNFDERQSPVNMVVLHYTGMADAASAIARLTDPEAKVSAHYLIAEDGQVVRSEEHTSELQSLMRNS